MASAIGLSRNDVGAPFPHIEDAEALEGLRDQVTAALRETEDGPLWTVYDLSKLSSVEFTCLAERGLMTPSFARGSGFGRGFAVYGDGEASLEINGIDHLQLLGYRDGEHLSELWSILNVLDDRLETAANYAFDPRWGYLTARPSHAGTGMRVFATVHVPALMLTGRFAALGLELLGQGFGIAPLWGGAGGLLQISNLTLQGKPEEEILQQVNEISKGIVEKERSVRKMLYRENPLQVKDHIGRALGVLQHAWSVTFAEAVSLVSAAQVGMDVGIVEAPGLFARNTFDFLRRLQPAHLMMQEMDSRSGCLETPEIDEVRARVLRNTFLGASVRA
jgi:protein arginine kinase